MAKGEPKFGIRITAKRMAQLNSGELDRTDPALAKKLREVLKVKGQPEALIKTEKPKTQVVAFQPKKAVRPIVQVEKMDVPSYLKSLDELCEQLRAISVHTTHEAEAAFLRNTAVCIERQFKPKYFAPAEPEVLKQVKRA